MSSSRIPTARCIVGTVWPGDSVFPDFTLTRVRDWWGGLYKDFVNMGIAGFWNDMNEPSVFQRSDKTMPLDTVHRLDDGTTLDHRAIHNVFGMENVRATYDGLLKLQADERPFVLTRAAYAGTERYAATWTGDNSATWNHIRHERAADHESRAFRLLARRRGCRRIRRLAACRSSDALVRARSLLSDLSRSRRERHRRSRALGERPRAGSDPQALHRAALQTLPYIYTAWRNTAHRRAADGANLSRVPEARKLYGDDHEFLFGRDFFVAPVVTEKVDAEDIHLPPGDWYDFWTAQKHSSKNQISLHPALAETPSLRSRRRDHPHAARRAKHEEKPDGSLEIRVYAGDDCHGTLYEDDGHTFAYQQGEFRRTNYTCKFVPGSITVSATTEKNSFQPWWQTAQVTIFGAPAEPKELRIGQQVTRDWQYDPQSHSVSTTVSNAQQNWTIRLTF